MSVGRSRESVIITVQKNTKRTITKRIFRFYGRWQPTLRCVTATYCNKARTEWNGKHIRGCTLFTHFYHMCIINTISLYYFSISQLNHVSSACQDMRGMTFESEHMWTVNRGEDWVAAGSEASAGCGGAVGAMKRQEPHNMQQVLDDWIKYFPIMLSPTHSHIR